MSEREEWGPWIEHDGRSCPVMGRYVHLVVGPTADGIDPALHGTGMWCGVEGLTRTEAVGLVRDPAGFIWADTDWFPVIRYRVRKPRALIELREMVESLPARRVREGVQ